MAEYIDKDYVTKCLMESWANCGIPSDAKNKMLKWLNKAPTAADVQPVKHGRWVWDEDGMDWGLGAWRCSACGTRPGTWWQGDHRAVPMRCSGSKFCGNCGAEMGMGD